MTGEMMIILIAVAVWIGWPLYNIADHLGSLRKLAERGRRD